MAEKKIIKENKMTLRINKLIYISLAVFLIVGISGCTESNSGTKSGELGSLSKSSISLKLAASESSGIFSEKATPEMYGSCNGELKKYKAVYNNGATLDITWNIESKPPCGITFFGIQYTVKNPDTFRGFDAYDYRIGFLGQTPGYAGPSGIIYWTADGRVDPSKSTGDVNEANEYLNLGKAKANEIVNRYNSGQLR